MHPISYFQAIVLGLVQGVSELFPISSLGHAVVLPRVFGWNIHQNDKFFLTFLVAVHLATALVLLGFFWRDWVRIVNGIGRSIRDREIASDDADARLGWLLVVATIPAGILGLTLESPLRKLFASPTSAAIFLIVNGLLLFGAEHLRKRAPNAPEREADEDNRIAHRVSLGPVRRHRRLPGAGADPGHLTFGRDDGRRPARGPQQRGCRQVRLPDGDPDHPRRRRTQASRAVWQGRKRRPGTGAGRRAVRGDRRLLLGALSDEYFETNRLTPFAIYCVVVGIALTIGFAVTS